MSLEQYLDKLPKESFHIGQKILRKGKVYDYCYIIISGEANAYLKDAQGVMRRLLPIHRHQMFPANWINSQDLATARDYDAYSDVVCAKVTYDDFQTIMKDPAIASELFVAQGEFLKHAMYRIETLVHPLAETRILYLFRYLLEVASVPTEMPGIYILTYSGLSQSRLGAILGLTRETTGKAINNLMEKGIVSMQSRKYVINKSMLMPEIEGVTNKPPKKS